MQLLAAGGGDKAPHSAAGIGQLVGGPREAFSVSFVPVQCPLVAAAFAENGIDELLELRAWRMLASTQGQGGK